MPAPAIDPRQHEIVFNDLRDLLQRHTQDPALCTMAPHLYFHALLSTLDYLAASAGVDTRSMHETSLLMSKTPEAEALLGRGIMAQRDAMKGNTP